MQLVSQSLPIGGYTYSQGLEWAVERGWVNDAESLQGWLQDLVKSSLTYLEVPMFFRLRSAIQGYDAEAFRKWLEIYISCRETAELRLEESQRGKALAKLLVSFELYPSDIWLKEIERTQLGGMSYITTNWGISAHDSIRAIVWGWMEGLVMAGVKLVPLGQTQGQQIVFSMSECLANAIKFGEKADDDEIGYSCFSQAIASSCHEQQYTRLYRS